MPSRTCRLSEGELPEGCLQASECLRSHREGYQQIMPLLSLRGATEPAKTEVVTSSCGEFESDFIYSLFRPPRNECQLEVDGIYDVIKRQQCIGLWVSSSKKQIVHVCQPLLMQMVPTEAKAAIRCRSSHGNDLKMFRRKIITPILVLASSSTENYQRPGCDTYTPSFAD